MAYKRSILAGVTLVMLVSLGGCSDEPGVLYITPWDSFTDRFTLTEGAEHKVNVRMSRAVDDTTYVDITNESYDKVKITEPSSGVLKYKGGEQTKQVTIYGNQDTGGKYFKLVFKIRNTTQSRDLLVRVKKSVVPDFGLPPDYTYPDTSSTVDSKTVDSKTTADSKPADAGTPDK